jgi:hypothetical protein
MKSSKPHVLARWLVEHLIPGAKSEALAGGRGRVLSHAVAYEIELGADTTAAGTCDFSPDAALRMDRALARTGPGDKQRRFRQSPS